MNRANSYPRPDFAREEWESLNGTWEFAFDDGDSGEREEWYRKGEFSLSIQVPFAYQTQKSGIGDPTPHDRVWYRRHFAWRQEMRGKRVFLRFGAVDYEAKVWLNGVCLGGHKGGYTPFAFEVTPYLQEENTLTVRAADLPDTAQPRGKQYWKPHTDRCWYTPTTGIWQDVWLETTRGARLESVQLTPNIDTNTIAAQAVVDRYTPGDSLNILVSYGGRPVKDMRVSLDGKRTRFVLSLREEDAIDEVHYWSPENPNLYDVSYSLLSGGVETDAVKSYFGMRKVTMDGGRVMLNHKPCYLKMILDQGYWKESGLTPPSEDALIHDIQLTKEMGFNGARKHQKPEDPRYYYWADRLGLLVWGEMPSGYEFCADEMANLSRDFQEFVARDYNHPSIIAWVPLNESWGVRKLLTDDHQQAFARSLYHLAKALDSTRLVSTNDGWENVKTDIVGLHDYAGAGAAFTNKYTRQAMNSPEGLYPMGRRLFAHGEQKENKCVFMVTEYGGIALESSVSGENWGYCGAEQNADQLLERYADVTGAILAIPEFAGFCYTQLTDVYQEVNGLLDMDHNPKFDCAAIRKINEGR